ncbi:MAG TPA: nucleoside hydrolase [Pirellulales bacterium]|nr:nucleoside hydrolase [Pirellulales bacterium]
MITKKVILDVDPGIDDAVALTLALFEPQWEVVAVTASGGNVLPDQATRNVQAVIEQLDPPRWPRLGVASLPDDGLPVHGSAIHGADGLGNSGFLVSELQHRHQSEKVLADQIRAIKEDLTLVALGPLTNVDRAFQRDPELAGMLGQMVVKGGTFAGPGDITAAAEFNIYCDPAAARRVFRTPTTKTLIPLDVTRQVLFTYDLLQQLPGETSRAGRFLRKVLPFLFRSHRQVLGIEGIYLHEAVALVAALHPELFEIEMTAGDVETGGELTTGATVFDRRRIPEWRPNIALATGLDVAGVMDCILRGLAAAGAASEDA